MTQLNGPSPSPAAPSSADRQRLRELLDKMTPGDWERCTGTHGDSCICGLVWSRAADRVVASVNVSRCEQSDHGDCAPPDAESKANTEGIALLRNLALPLLDALDAAESEVSRLREDAERAADALRGKLAERDSRVQELEVGVRQILGECLRVRREAAADMDRHPPGSDDYSEAFGRRNGASAALRIADRLLRERPTYNREASSTLGPSGV